MFANNYWNVSILMTPFGTERGRHHRVDIAYVCVSAKDQTTPDAAVD